MRNKRCLVVDDDPGILNLLQECLESHGCAVEIAENGREALAKLDHVAYDLVLLDYIMPEVNGLEVLRHIQEHHQPLPVVMMTGERSSQVSVSSFLALGARACLFKPFDLLELEQALKCMGVVPNTEPRRHEQPATKRSLERWAGD